MMQQHTEQNIFERYSREWVDGVPKYAQLREVLIAAINDGYWGAGERLPNEKDLADRSDLSLGTVQRAMRALVDQGLVVRRQGEGTFVSTNDAAMDSPWHCRFVGDAAGEILPVYPQIIDRKPAVHREPASGLLGGPVCQIDRTIWIGDEFRVYSRFLVSRQRYGAFAQWSIGELETVNFKTVLRQQYNIQIRSLLHHQRVGVLPDDVADAIGRAKGSQGLLLEITAYGTRSAPVYYQELYIPPTERRLVIEC